MYNAQRWFFLAWIDLLNFRHADGVSISTSQLQAAICKLVAKESVVISAQCPMEDSDTIFDYIKAGDLSFKYLSSVLWTEFGYHR